jgi:integrase
MTGARTEEVRALRWDHVVSNDADRQAWIPVSVAGWNHERFAIYVWRSVRTGGDTKTKKSRRTLASLRRCVVALRGHYDAAPAAARQGGAAVFTRSDGAQLDRRTALRAFRKVVHAAGLPPGGGYHGRCGIALCRCCRTTACPWRTSRGSSATSTPRQPRPSTRSRSAR